MSASPELLRGWSHEAPKTVDLTLPEQDAWVRSVADQLVELYPDAESLVDLEEASPEAPVLLRLAMKLAQSRRRLLGLGRAFRVSVVFAVYKEHNRLRTREEHPHGEDFLVRKVEQIRWLLSGLRGAAWDMFVVDDGCPEKSGVIAQSIIDAQGLGDRVRVLFLEDAIDSGHPLAKGLESTADSQKGGSIQYGMGVASEGEDLDHVVVFTDADLSTHLGQLGLLVDPILRRGFDAAIGSRRRPLSVVIKEGARNTRGKLFIYLWKRLVTVLNPIIDTQCGFKGFRANVASTIVRDTVEKRFAFDIELLVRTQLARQGSIARVPIAWIDSEAASTTKELQPYLAMLRSIVKIADRYLPAKKEASAFAEMIASLDEASWGRLAENVPPQIADREPFELENFDGVSPEELSAAAHDQR